MPRLDLHCRQNESPPTLVFLGPCPVVPALVVLALVGPAPVARSLGRDGRDDLGDELRQ